MGLTKLTLLTKEETMTSRDLSIFNTLRPFSIGFDDMFDDLSDEEDDLDSFLNDL